jgi:hypothetical protein
MLKKRIEKRLAAMHIEWLVEEFRKLNASQQKKFLERIREV